MPTPIKRPHEMSIEDLRATREQRERELRDERTTKTDEKRSAGERRRENQALVSRARAELARDMGVSSPAFLGDALERVVPINGPHADRLTAEMYIPLRGLLGALAYAEDIDVTAAIESRICLAAIKGPLALPPVRKDDAVFGVDAAAQIRVFPPAASSGMHSPPAPKICDLWFESILKHVGIAGTWVPRAPSTVDDAKDEIERVHQHRERKLYSKDYSQNLAMALREIELIEAASRKAFDLSVGGNQSAGSELRGKLLAVVEAAIKGQPFGAAWWWGRQLRRLLAGERAVMTDGQHVWFACTEVLKLPLDFSTVTA